MGWLRWIGRMRERNELIAACDGVLLELMATGELSAREKWGIVWRRNRYM